MVPATFRPAVTSLQSGWMWERSIQLPTSSDRSVNNVTIHSDRVLSTHSRCHAGAQIASLGGLQIVDSCGRRRINSSLLQNARPEASSEQAVPADKLG